MTWACSKCTFVNPPTQKSNCQICLSPIPTPSSSSSPSSSTQPKWACKACTFLNSYTRSNCEICDTPSSLSSFSAFDEMNSDNPNEIDDSGPSIGSVFFPLKPCSKREELDPDLIVVSGDLCSKRKFEKSDDSSLIGETGFRALKSARKEEIVYVTDKAEVDNESVSTIKKHSGSDTSSNGLSSIKILSYNVWFREDLNLEERMEAIGNLIHLHSPHIICLQVYAFPQSFNPAVSYLVVVVMVYSLQQEVTPNIFNIFQSSSWWKIYQSSVSREKAYSSAYFCMLLTKLPVKSFNHKPFSNSVMGRELSIAELQLDPNNSLVVATSHLESPCPGPPKWDQMYSKERVAQANESINLLKKHQNVVFGGDMNWDDKLDGPFPFPVGWTDAWAHLRPAEIGFTYDTKSNKMLSGNRTLQKRLDRFICSLQDFKVSGIEMVGMEEIPGLSYCKDKKGRNGIQKLTLPVLPSDHFGLLLTITKL
ncbi:hypothetical protein V2J09_016868 [Rumex salicifolius]